MVVPEGVEDRIEPRLKRRLVACRLCKEFRDGPQNLANSHGFMMPMLQWRAAGLARLGLPYALCTGATGQVMMTTVKASRFRTCSTLKWVTTACCVASMAALGASYVYTAVYWSARWHAIVSNGNLVVREHGLQTHIPYGWSLYPRRIWVGKFNPKYDRRLWNFGLVWRKSNTSWTVTVVAVWPFVVLPICAAAVAWWRDRRRFPAGCCSACGYDLTGNVSGTCPECGQAVAEDRGALSSPLHQRFDRRRCSPPV